MSHKIIYLFLLLLCALGAKAQLSQGGEPYSAHLLDYLKNPTKEKAISKVLTRKTYIHIRKRSSLMLYAE